MSAAKPNYFLDFLQSPGNVFGMLGGAAVAVLLSFPYGATGAALPLLATLGVEVIACLFVPDMTSFRRWADEQRKKGLRAESGERLVEEIRKRCASPNEFRRYVEDYDAVVRQVRSLLALTRDKPGALSVEDVDCIADVPIEYLSLSLSLLVMDERADAIDLRDINRKLAQISAQIERPAEGTDLRQLERARDEYEALIARHQRMMSKRTAIEAALVALPDQLAEIYQMVMGEGSQNDGARLSGAISSLRLRQDIESEIEEDLSGTIPELQSIKSATRRNIGMRMQQ